MPILFFTTVAAPPVSGASLAFGGRLRVTTDLGVVAPGARLYTYFAGTPSTPLPSYADYLSTIPNDNPVVADAGGLLPPIYLAPGQAYHLVLTEADGTPIWDQDFIGDGLSVPPIVTTAINDAIAAAFAAQAAGALVVQTSTAVGAQNNFALTPNVSLLRLNNATAMTISGFSAGVDGQRITIESVGAGQVDLAHQSGLSSAGNRLINFATSGNTPLAAGVGTAVYQYDALTARWKLITHEQGAWITPPFDAGDYTASTGSWTVDAGDVNVCTYWLRGRTLSVNLDVGTTTVSASPSSLKRAVPGGFTVAARSTQLDISNDNSTGTVTGVMQVLPGGTTIGFTKLSGTWAAATNTTNLDGVWAFEVQ